MENYRAMAIFVHVVQCGSFSAAAERLGITKSAVSQQISQLEDELNTRLLQRTTRKLHLTEAGELYLAGCRKMVEAAEVASYELGRLKNEPTGTLRITSSTDFAARGLIPLIAPFMSRYPKLSLDFDGSDAAINLVEEGIDLALRIGNLSDSNLVARKIADIPIALVAAPAYLETYGEPQEPADLIKHQWIALTQISTPYQVTLKGEYGQSKKVRLYGRACSNNTIIAREMAVAGMGIAQLLANTVQNELVGGQLKRVLPDYHIEPLGLYAVYPQRSHVPLKVRVLIDYLIENRDNLVHGRWAE